MLIRVFRTTVVRGREDEYLRVLETEALPHFRAAPGIVSTHLGTPVDGATSEFLVVTVWRRLGDLRAFVGPRWNEAKILPGERDLIQSCSVHHYEAAPTELLPVHKGPVSALASEDTVLEVGRLRIDLLRRRAWVADQEIVVPPREFAVLAELAKSYDVPVPASELARRAWPDRTWGSDVDIRRVIYHLRVRLQAHADARSLIQNRRGYGYVLERPDDDQGVPAG